MSQPVNSQHSVFTTLELLSTILHFLPQSSLHHLVRVCTLWRDLISTTPSLQRATFNPNVPECKNTPRILNEFVIDRLRWSPSLDIAKINSEDFAGVNNQSSRAMAEKEASWKWQLLSYPPLMGLMVVRGTIEQEEEHLQGLRIVCRGGRVGEGMEGGGKESEGEYKKWVAMMRRRRRKMRMRKYCL
ncbi:hypothetical protein BDD12DRAFT_944989 [Trichophaea hybrida]|nr:hypothetical protein BDD12DRAFT_944989 [Trichophaea hybrida]